MPGEIGFLCAACIKKQRLPALFSYLIFLSRFGKYDPGAVVFVDDLHASAKGYEYMAQAVIWHQEHITRKAGD